MNKAKNKKSEILVGPPIQSRDTMYSFYRSGDFRIYKMSLDFFVMTNEENDDVLMGWEYEDDPIIPEHDDVEYHDDEEEDDDNEIFFFENNNPKKT